MLYVFSMCLVLYSCEYNALVNIDLVHCLSKLVLCLWLEWLVWYLWFVPCLYTTWGLVCLLSVVLFSCCDARDKRYRGGIWKGFIGERWEFISLINEEKSRNIMLKSGKLLSELASIYIYFGSHVLLIKSISDLCGVCHNRYDLKTLFQNISILFWYPLWRY